VQISFSEIPLFLLEMLVSPVTELYCSLKLHYVNIFTKRSCPSNDVTETCGEVYSSYCLTKKQNTATSH
jgi:hypothetical protein